MRALTLFALALSLAALPGCFTSAAEAHGTFTVGDRGATEWQIFDGLCVSGLFGDHCALDTPLSVGADPTIEIVGRSGTQLSTSTMVVASGAVTVLSTTTSTDDHGVVTVHVHLSATGPGQGDLRVLDATSAEIDRAHVTITAPASLVCGFVPADHPREYTFASLMQSNPIVLSSAASDNRLGCRTLDASSRPLLTANAILWHVESGAHGTISVASDDLLATMPAHGATARVSTMGQGDATITASLGTLTQALPITFH
jgi:hypothetical protein